MKTKSMMSLLGLVVLTCLTMAAPGAFAADVVFGAIVKEIDYVQSNGGQSYDGNHPYIFGAHALGSSSGSLTGGTVLANTTVLGTLDTSSPPSGDFRDTFATQEALDATYPAGNYTLTLNTVNDSNPSITLGLGLGSATYPNAPFVTNYDDLQAIDPNQSTFTVSWNAMSGGSAADFIFVQIRGGEDGNEVFSTPWPGQSGTLDGTATSVEIPTSLLEPGQSYDLSIIFARVDTEDASSYPGVPIFTSFLTADDMTIQTIPEPATLSLLALGGLALMRRRRA